METINDKCCETFTKESCCDRPIYNVYVGPSSCCATGSDNGTSDHDQLENKNLGIQHDASAIGFADGETFQEKYDKGELTGPQGDQGSQGEQGPQGGPGLQGDKGDAGLSAYEIAINQGFIGTEADWIESLKGDIGPKGADGATGPQGPVGATGAKGDTGSQGVSGSNGFSPVITVAEQTDSTYKLNIKTATGNFDTPNLMGGSTLVIGVVGTLEKRALTANVHTKVKFIPTEGDTYAINTDGEWICPKDGIYDFCVDYGQTSTSAGLSSWFQINSPNSFSQSGSRGFATTGLTGQGNGFMTSNAKMKLLKNDNISFWAHSTAAQTATSYNSSFIITFDSSMI